MMRLKLRNVLNDDNEIEYKTIANDKTKHLIRTNLREGVELPEVIMLKELHEEVVGHGMKRYVDILSQCLVISVVYFNIIHLGGTIKSKKNMIKIQ